MIPIVIGALGMVPKGLENKLEESKPFGKNAEKSPAIIQTPLKDNQLLLE